MAPADVCICNCDVWKPKQYKWLFRDSASVKELDKNGGIHRRNHSQNQDWKGWKTLSHSALAPTEGERGCCSTAADSIGVAGWHLVGMTVRMSWNGQGFGDVPIKPGISMKVTWVAGFPKEIRSAHLLWGHTAECRSLIQRYPQRQNQGTGNGVPARVWHHLWLWGVIENIWEVQNGCWSDPQAESQAGRGKLGQKVRNDGVTPVYQGVINKDSWGQTAY